jgi:hypothetical protein
MSNRIASQPGRLSVFMRDASCASGAFGTIAESRTRGHAAGGRTVLMFPDDAEDGLCLNPIE